MTEDLDQLIERYHSALSEFMTGNAKPAVAFFSRRDDITLANPFGPVVRGQNQVKLAAERAAMNYRGGRAISFEPFAKCVTHDLAYLVEVERYEAQVGGSVAETDRVMPFLAKLLTDHDLSAKPVVTAFGVIVIIASTRGGQCVGRATLPRP